MTARKEVEPVVEIRVNENGTISVQDLRDALRPEIRKEIRAATTDTMLSTAEAAELIGVSRQWIFNRVQAGKLTDHGNGNGTAAKLSKREVLIMKRARDIKKKRA